MKHLLQSLSIFIAFTTAATLNDGPSGKDIFRAIFVITDHMPSDFLHRFGNVIEVEADAGTIRVDSQQAPDEVHVIPLQGTESHESKSTRLSSVKMRVLTEFVSDESSGKTCCLLGQVAGDKGFHCNVAFYAENLVERNRNRAHLRKMSFYGRERIAGYGGHDMRRFDSCSGSEAAAEAFGKCCFYASQERHVQRHDSSLYHVSPV